MLRGGGVWERWEVCERGGSVVGGVEVCGRGGDVWERWRCVIEVEKCGGRGGGCVGGVEVSIGGVEMCGKE